MSDTGDLFHLPKYSREVLLAMLRQFLCIDVKRRFCRGHAELGFCRRLQNQLEILVHKPQRKLRAVVAARNPRQLSQMSWSDHGRLCQNIKQAMTIQTHLLAKDDGLRDCLHANTE